MAKKTYNIHDRGYKMLFSNKTFIKKLFESFVSEKWVKDIDFSNLKRFETSFVSKKFAKRECDILYRVKYKNRQLKWIPCQDHFSIFLSYKKFPHLLFFN